ncbi:hypothetical protein L1987_06297 [Smallanthus sonchifolius]|uniref:Uncharacterized protein n=1 Tax=Smallanthus sonchifolius TaxID=185202 RepID=A0ACB9JXR2_9ASTR|nr:hypothetical protein L1987_06297 [Smallanthus sonchifolius]
MDPGLSICDPSVSTQSFLSFYPVFFFSLQICSKSRSKIRISMRFLNGQQWLDKLAFASARESAAYGLWNFSFGTLPFNTGHASAEQLTKYVLYCE